MSKTSEVIFDVVIIGAGINGAGIARDAAMRGLKVLLLDKGDVGGGTSSWSTRLIHGGLRYLEHGDVGLVRESLRERETLLKIAPHLVRPLPVMIPIYKGARRGWWTIRAGMLAYDLLSFGKILPAYRMLSAAEAIDKAPALEMKGLEGAAVYYDAQVEFAERLVVENAISAKEHGAQVLTYTRVDKLIFEDEIVSGVRLTHELTGEHSEASGRVVINAAGPWVDQILNTERKASRRLIGGTKGSHIIVEPFAGAPATAIYVEAGADQRPSFIIPWNANYLIGTTDIRFDGDLDKVRIDESEIYYLLSETNRVFPSAKIDRSKILYTYSGIRPLPFTDDKDEESITRRHFIRRHSDRPNLLSIVGGKLTTYRSLAEEAVDLIFNEFGQDIPRCTTDTAPLPGGETDNFSAFEANLRARYELSNLTCEHLVTTYGVAAASVMDLVSEDSRLAAVIDPESGAIAAEVVHAFEAEMALTLADCLLRRTMVGLNSTLGLDAVEEAARVGREFLGWSTARAAGEVEAYRHHVKKFQL
jgi:glycerol-3-phosphate dehydrogenase